MIKKYLSVLTAVSATFISISNFLTDIKGNDVNALDLKSEDKTTILSEELTPDAVSYDDVIKKGHCGRAYDLEQNLNTVAFTNIDGTESLYLFSYPVKYVDENNEIKDKSLRIDYNQEENVYITSSSDVKTRFNDNLGEGIELSYKDILINTIPLYENNEEVQAELSEDGKVIKYICNDDLYYEYSLTFQGYKENVFISNYTGNNSCEFLLRTNGLSFGIKENKAVLFDEEENIVANFGDLLIYDAKGHLGSGELTYETISENEEYKVSLTINEEFLTAEDTVYPICIDPTIEIDYSHGSWNEGIVHSTVYSDNTVTNNSTMIIGKYSSNRKARTVMAFPGLSTYVSNGRYGTISIDSSFINNATVYVRDVGYQSDLNAMNISCYGLNKLWYLSNPNDSTLGLNYESLSWNFVTNNFGGRVLSNNIISNSTGLQQTPVHTYAFDITNKAQKWGNTFNADFWMNGIIFKSEDSVENGTTKYCSFGAYSSGIYAPYLVIDLDAYQNYDFKGNVNVTYTYQKELTLNANTTYVFKTGKATNYADCDTELFLFKKDSPSSISLYNNDISSTNKYSQITITPQTTEKYILMAKVYSISLYSGPALTGYCNVYQKTGSGTQQCIKSNAKLGGYELTSSKSLSSSKIYNSFTTNLSSGTDPIMFVMDRNSSNDTKKVVGYNDDYSNGSSGGFSWGRNSRLEQTYQSNDAYYTKKCVFITAYTSTTEGTADIYAFCEGKYYQNNYQSNSQFPNYKTDDQINSYYNSGVSYSYNCIAYSGGIFNVWINPTMSDDGNNLLPWYNNNNIIALNNFYGNNPPRYAGAMTYELTTNESDAIVNVYKNGSDWTHAAVRRNANYQNHGYSWESKLGNGPQVFHDLNSLDNTATGKYGQVARMYKVSSESAGNSYGNHTMEESIELGLTQFQDISLDESEIIFLVSKLSQIPLEERKNFINLFEEWEKRVSTDNELMLYGNYKYYFETDEYRELSSFIEQNNDLLYMIIERYINGGYNVFINALFSDKIVARNTSTIEVANNIRERNNAQCMKSYGEKTYTAPSLDTNVKCFIKEILDNKGKILQ